MSHSNQSTYMYILLMISSVHSCSRSLTPRRSWLSLGLWTSSPWAHCFLAPLTVGTSSSSTTSITSNPPCSLLKVRIFIRFNLIILDFGKVLMIYAHGVILNIPMLECKSPVGTAGYILVFYLYQK